MSKKVIEFQHVSVNYPNGKQALREISFSISAGECLALVGESGCGKSTLARSSLGMLPPNTKIKGSIKIGEVEIIGAAKEVLRNQRGLVVGFVPQNPFSAFHPLKSVGDFVSEAWRVHSRLPPKNAVENAFEKLGLENVFLKIKQLPHEWSGGMLQRAGIAAASAHLPKLIIADEPTSSLDSELNQVVLDSLKSTNTAILLITHDLRLVEKYADKIAVMKDGQIVEIGASNEIFQNPKHEFSRQLLSVSQVIEQTITNNPANPEVVLEAKNLSHFYGRNRIIENVNLQIKQGEIIGISGRSGCGKSTLLRLLATIETPESGEVFLGGELAVSGKTKKLLSKNTRNGFVMPIFQDSFSSIDRCWALWRIITEPLTAKHWRKRLTKAQRREIAKRKLAEVGLHDVDLDSRPTQLSIGQCQRIAIARALTAEAKIITADEPTSSLDVFNGERIMKIFAETAEKGTAIIIVSHNQELLKKYSHRIISLNQTSF